MAIAGGVSHLSTYALTPEVGTPIYTDYLNGELLSDDEVADLYDGVVEEEGKPKQVFEKPKSEKLVHFLSNLTEKDGDLNKQKA